MTDKKDKKVTSVKGEQVTCDVVDEAEVYEKTKREYTASDVYYKTECKLEDSEVAIPTYDAVVEAKEWVDNENKR